MARKTQRAPAAEALDAAGLLKKVAELRSGVPELGRHIAAGMEVLREAESTLARRVLAQASRKARRPRRRKGQRVSGS